MSFKTGEFENWWTLELMNFKSDEYLIDDLME